MFNVDEFTRIFTFGNESYWWRRKNSGTWIENHSCCHHTIILEAKNYFGEFSVTCLLPTIYLVLILQDILSPAPEIFFVISNNRTKEQKYIKQNSEIIFFLHFEIHISPEKMDKNETRFYSIATTLSKKNS